MGREDLKKRGNLTSKFMLVRFLIVLFLIFVSSISLFSKGVFSDEDTFFIQRSPTFKDSKYFLLGEDIVFGVKAKDIDDVTFYTKCLENSENRFHINTDFITYRVTDDTFLTGFRMLNATCQEMELAAKYVKNDEIVTQSKIIRIVYYNPIPKSILDEQMETGDWNEHPLSTAYAIFALSRYGESYDRQIDLGMRWLKENRGEDDKCWETEDCRIDTTAKIHAILWLSKYTDTYRIMHNSRLWLLDQQNIVPKDQKWTFYLNASLNFTECIYNESATKKNETIISAITINETNSYVVKPFIPAQGEKYDIVCTQDIDFKLIDHENQMRYNGSFDNISYEVPDKCWDDDTKWNICDFETTGFALLSDIPAENKNYALTWMKKKIKTNAYGTYVDYNRNNSVSMSEKVVNTALYLYNTPADKKVLDWLLYNQNNDGSFGNYNDTFEDKLEITVYAILAMEKAGLDDNDEAIYDAKSWIYTSVPYGNWDTVKKSSLAHVALSSFSKKYLNVNPMIIEVGDSPVNVELYNPTPYYFSTLTVSFTGGLASYLDVSELKTISSGTYKLLTLKTKTGMKTGDYYGTMIIKNGADILNEISVVVGKKPILSFSYPDKNVIFGSKGTLDLKATIDDASYKCDIKWDSPEMSGDSEFTLDKKTSTASIKYTLSQEVPRDTKYIGKVTCVVNNKKVFSDIIVNIKQYKTQPFDLSDSLITIEKARENYAFNITNKIDDPVTLYISFKTAEVFFEFDNNEVTISPGDTVTITIMNLAETDVNVSSSNSIIVKTKEGVEKRITFNAEFYPEIKNSFNFMLIVYVVIGLLVLLMIFLNFFLMFRKNLINSASEKMKPGLKKFEAIVISIMNKFLPKNMRLTLTGSEPEENSSQKTQKTHLESDENVDYHISDMIDIMRSLSKPDAIIRKELEQEGFSRELIDKGIAEADKIVTEREEKKKKKSSGAAGQVGQ